MKNDFLADTKNISGWWGIKNTQKGEKEWNQKMEKNTFKVVQMKFLAMHITNQHKFSYLR